MKQFYFLNGLPRCGNTLLSTIINKNKNIKVTANSIIPDIVWNLCQQKNTGRFINFPDHKSFDNVINNVFNNYYQNWEANIIIDRAPWGTPGNLYVLKQIFKNRKFIILERPILEVLASFVKIEKPENIEYRCDELMVEEGIIGKNFWSIQNLIKEKENYIMITYDKLVSNTKKEIQKIYNFLNIKADVDINNLEQFKINEVSYDDTINGCELHTIRVDSIKKIDYKIEDYLPTSVINKYRDIKIKL
jgi:hypothetical protein